MKTMKSFLKQNLVIEKLLQVNLKVLNEAMMSEALKKELNDVLGAFEIGTTDFMSILDVECVAKKESYSLSEVDKKTVLNNMAKAIERDADLGLTNSEILYNIEEYLESKPTTSLVLATYYDKLDGAQHRKEIMIKPVKDSVTDVTSVDELCNELNQIASSFKIWSLGLQKRSLLAFKNTNGVVTIK